MLCNKDRKRSKHSDACLWHSQTVMFCFAAIQALTAALSAAFGRIAPRMQSLACEVWGCGTMDYVTLAACIPATVAVVVWFVERHTMWAWPLQDAMGMALIMLLLRQFRLPDIKVNLACCARSDQALTCSRWRDLSTWECELCRETPIFLQHHLQSEVIGMRRLPAFCCRFASCTTYSGCSSPRSSWEARASWWR